MCTGQCQSCMICLGSQHAANGVPKHLFGVVVPVKAVCYVDALLCKFSIADLKLLIEYTLRTAVCNYFLKWAVYLSLTTVAFAAS